MASRRAPGERPSRPPRIDVAMPAALRTAEGHCFAVVVVDLSAHGFRVSLAEGDELLVGEPIQLTLDGEDPCQAVVRWSAGRQAGGTFSESHPLPH